MVENTSALAHVLCGTCVGEFERHCGYFESSKRRSSVQSLQKFETGTRAFCCNCGQDDWVMAVCRLKTNNDICDGNHIEVDL